VANLPPGRRRDDPSRPLPGRRVRRVVFLVASAITLRVALTRQAPPYRLTVLGGLTLSGPTGPIVVGDPLALPQLTRVLLAGADGVVEDDLLLCLTPNLTPIRGRARLAEATAALDRIVGRPLLPRSNARVLVDATLIEADVGLEGSGPPLTAGEAATFLSGVSLPEAPEFTDWVNSVRGKLRWRIATAPADSGGARASRIRVAIGLAGFILLAAVYGTRAAPPSGFRPGDPVVLADLENSTGDSLFDRSLPTAAVIGLQQSPQLRLVPRARVGAILQRMGQDRPDTVRLTPLVTREVAIRDNVRYFVTLRIDRDGDGYRLQGDIREAEPGRVVTTAEASSETRAGTLVALDRVLQAIRAGLGERRSERRARSVILPEATTPSLDALQSYALGTRAWQRGEYQIARELWERALDLDSGFALAMAGLGAFHYYHHARDEGKRYYEEAVRRAGRLTEWERYRVLDGYAGYRGDFDSSVTISKTIAERFPNAITWYNYGTSLLQAGRKDDAIEPLKRALGYDSTHVHTLVNLATALEGAEAIRTYRRAEQLDSTQLLRPPMSTEFGNELIVAGRFQEAEEHFRRVLRQPGLFDRIVGHRGLGFLAIWRGRPEQGLAHFRDASEAGRQGIDSLTISRNYLLEAHTLLLAGDTAVAQETMARIRAIIDRVRFGPRLLLLLGNGFLHTGQIAVAESLLAGIVARGDTSAQVDRSSRDLLAAGVATARGDGEKAIGLLDGLGRFDQVSLVLGWRARAELVRGNPARAREILATLSATPSATTEAVFEWLWSFWARGEIARQQGDKQAAVAAYRALLKQWDGGDASASLVRALKARLVALGAD